MCALLHPLDDAPPDELVIPDVRYVGRCPETGCERSLRPTPEVIAEAERLKRYLTSRGTIADRAATATQSFSSRGLYAPRTGKMFGVMLCRHPSGRLGTLRAFSGSWEGRWQPPGWVPSSSHLAEYEAQRERTEALLAELTLRIDALKSEPPDAERQREIEDCKAERRTLSRALTDQIHKAYRFENSLGEVLPLTEVDTGSRRPPTGMGDCCAPKLLQCAIRNQLDPLGMVEFWWGASPPALPRIEGAYYSSCAHKCYPILGFLLRGVAAAEVQP